MTTPPKSLEQRIKDWQDTPERHRGTITDLDNAAALVLDLIADRERLLAEVERLRKILALQEKWAASLATKQS